MDATPTTMAPPGYPVVQGEPPPVMVVQQQAYTGSHSHGSVGPVLGVLAVIAVLGIIAALVGRLCGGRTVMGYGGRFDMEEWVETKCSSCVDGYVGPPLPRPPPRMVVPDMEIGVVRGGERGNGTAVGPAPVVGASMMNTGEIKTEVNEDCKERESSDEEPQQQQQHHGYHQNHEQRHSNVEES